MSRAIPLHTGDAANSVVSRSQIGRALADRLAEDDGVRDLLCLEGNPRFMGDLMRLNPHLQFDGQCEAAFKFYEQCLSGKIVMMMTYGESPVGEQMQTECRRRILHTTLAVGNYLLQGADVPQESYQRPQGFSVMLNVEDATEAERIFNSLSQNGAVQMPLQETFWAMRFGMLVDQFGTPWTVNCGKPR